MGATAISAAGAHILPDRVSELLQRQPTPTWRRDWNVLLVQSRCAEHCSERISSPCDLQRHVCCRSRVRGMRPFEHPHGRSRSRYRKAMTAGPRDTHASCCARALILVAWSRRRPARVRGGATKIKEYSRCYQGKRCVVRSNDYYICKSFTSLRGISGTRRRSLCT